jgi:DNA repair photolyase
VLRHELVRKNYTCQPINIGSNTDPYQPIEKTWRLTRAALALLEECNHPCTIVTKNALIERDLDILVPMAERRLVQVFISINSLDNKLASKLEPRASAPHRRMQAVKTLRDAGVPVGVLVAPIIPALNEKDVEAVIAQAGAAGANSIGYTCVRLPHELKQLFREWLELHYPDRAAHIISLIQQMNGGKDYDSNFATRMRGQGCLRTSFVSGCRWRRGRRGWSGPGIRCWIRRHSCRRGSLHRRASCSDDIVNT